MFKPCGWHPARRPQPHRRNRPWQRFAVGLVWTCTPRRCSRRRWTASRVSCGAPAAGRDGARWWRSAPALPGPTRVAYEAGPTGFGLARALDAAGIGCVVAAPGKIERPAQDRVKTDHRDAERLLRLLMIDGLHPVRVPSGRGGGAARPRPRARGRARRSDARPAPAGQAAAAPRRPLRRRRRELDAAVTATGWRARARRPRRAGHAARLPRRDRRAGRSAATRSSARSASSIPGSPWARPSPGCAACAASTRSRPSGCAPRSATSQRFARPAQLMSYLGLVPSEHSTGDTRRQGRDHQDRLPARPPAAGRSRLALPPPTPHGSQALRAARPASPRT